MKKSKIRQPTGFRKTAGVLFQAESGEWSADIGPIKLTLDNYSYKCTAIDTRNGYFRGFHTVIAAKLFAKRRKHLRSIVRHQQTERLKSDQERLGLSLAELAYMIGISPRTVEAYFSGARTVPESLVFESKSKTTSPIDIEF